MSAIRRCAAAILYALSWCCWVVTIPIAALACALTFAGDWIDEAIDILDNQP